jgi:hypothetical protein
MSLTMNGNPTRDFAVKVHGQEEKVADRAKGRFRIADSATLAASLDDELRDKDVQSFASKAATSRATWLDREARALRIEAGIMRGSFDNVPEIDEETRNRIHGLYANIRAVSGRKRTDMIATLRATIRTAVKAALAE